MEGIGRDYLYEVNGIIWFPASLKSNVLGLLKVKKLKKIDTLHINTSEESLMYQDLTLMKNIINKHLKSDRNIRKCKLELELEEAGLSDYAKL